MVKYDGIMVRGDAVLGKMSLAFEEYREGSCYRNSRAGWLWLGLINVL